MDQSRRRKRGLELSSFVVVGASILFATLLLIVYTKSVTGRIFINSYPYISDDGFDWIFQGHALSKRLLSGESIFLPILRQPVGVIVWTIDSLLEANGFFFILLNILSYSALLCLLRSVMRNYASDFSTSCFLITFSFLPFHGFAFYALADHLAVALGLLAFRLLSERKSGTPSFSLGCFLLLLAGLTKTYALIPGGVVLITHMVSALRHMKYRAAAWLLLSGLGIGGAFVVITVIWRSSFEYGSVPNTFSLLRLSGAMLPYYVDLALYVLCYLVPLVMYLAIVSWISPSDEKKKEVIRLRRTTLAIVLLQVGLSILYQWKDARFTFLYMPYLFLYLSTFLPYKSSEVAFSGKWLFLLLAPLTTLFVTPHNGYFNGTFSSLTIDSQQSWLSFYSAERVDRMRLKRRCGNRRTICEKALIPKHASPYQRKILKAYIQLHSRYE